MTIMHKNGRSRSSQCLILTSLLLWFFFASAGEIVHHLQFCSIGRTLCVAHEGGLVLVYNFSDSAKTAELQVIGMPVSVACSEGFWQSVFDRLAFVFFDGK